ncbi:hypothetical protein AAE250_03125 [Bacteroides sp. GD17]|jgi:hypothetical protein|uniref:hypothetical protein n=1 Tax=Bacteroides sp. GD17 TaxID=3139826 RepID=UPI00313BA7FC
MGTKNNVQTVESANEVNNNSKLEAMNAENEKVATPNAMERNNGEVKTPSNESTNNDTNMKREMEALDEIINDTNSKDSNEMNDIDFFDTINTSEVASFNVSSEKVKKIKKDLLPHSSLVELTIKNIDGMLGLKVSIVNPGQDPVSYDLGVDHALLNTIMYATCGKYEKLKAYDPTNRPIEKGTEFKTEILKQLLRTKQPIQAQIKTVGENASIIEVSFQLGYRRKLKIYFSGDDTNVIKMLKNAGLSFEKKA